MPHSKLAIAIKSFIFTVKVPIYKTIKNCIKNVKGMNRFSIHKYVRKHLHLKVQLPQLHKHRNCLQP